MNEITNITADPSQRHIIPLEDSEIILDLRFFPQVQQWFINVEWKGSNTKGIKLSLGVLHLANSNYPFDFILTENAVTGIDCFKVDDFSGGRCQLFMLSPDEMEQFRGVPVEI